MGQHDGSFPFKGSCLVCKSFHLPFPFLIIPLGICPRSLANIIASQDCITKPPLNSQSKHVVTPNTCKQIIKLYISIISTCGIHAFALLELEERENLQMRDCLASDFHLENRAAYGDLDCAFCAGSFSLFQNRDLYAGQLE